LSQASAHLDYVDALRGVAILMVVLTHTAEAITGLSPLAAGIAAYAQTGVQLFFLASAYTLCLAAVRRAGEPLPMLSFFVRRYFRIAPLYYMAIALYFCVHLLEQALAHPGAPLDTQPYTIGRVLANVLFMHGFVPPANNNIVPGGWSIGTEMAFYLTFPQLFGILTLLASRSLRYAIAAPAAALGVNLAFQWSLIVFTRHYVHNDNFTYFNLVNQLPVFMLGMLAYFLQSAEPRLRWLDSKPLQWAGLATFTALAALLWRSELRLAFALIPTVAGVAFLFLLNLARLTDTGRRPLAAVGRVSYSMYVFHFLFAWNLTKAAVGWLPAFLPANALLVVCFGGAAGLSYGVARLSQRRIESSAITCGARLIHELQARREHGEGLASALLATLAPHREPGIGSR
jgi:peptidoglycan/LPS O-acetylase OafA/YrhL